jgi:two-component system sensor histidine kinase YesM
MAKYKNKLYRLPFKSIRMNMSFIFIILILSVLFIFWGISMKITKNAVVVNSTDYTIQLVNQVNSEIDNYITYMENISTILVTNMDIREYLNTTSEEVLEDATLRKRIISQFDTILNMREDIYNIAIFGENNKHIVNKGNDEINPNIHVQAQNWYTKAVKAGGKRILSSSHIQNVIYNDYKWVVTLSKAIHIKDTNEVLGALLVDLNYSSITKLCQKINLGNKGYIFLVDESGDIIYHPKQQLVYTGIKREKIADILSSKEDSFIAKVDNENKLYTMSKSEKTGWIVVGVANIDELFANQRETFTIYSLCAIALIIASIFTAIIYSNRITTPLTRLKNSMKEVENGNFTGTPYDETEDSEVGVLSRDFYNMTVKIENLMSDKVRAQRDKRKLEIKSLQNQINPHFLYNTLDSIIWMAEGGNNKEVVIMTSSLARLLRQNISNEEELITIENEINSIKSYLTIQKMRYKDQLRYIIDVDPEINHYKIVKLTLQPFVENAIYHGIKYRETKGTIIVKGRKKENGILIQIIDNGIGMSKETLNHIYDKKEIIKGHSGIAIENVNRRLKLYYGDEYSLLFESKEGRGTVVSITLPKREGDLVNEEI